MDLDKNFLEKADKTVQVVSRALEGLDFAITGSYAHFMIGGKPRNHFSYGSDIDVALFKEDFSRAADKLKNIEEYLNHFPCFGYDGGPPPVYPGSKFFMRNLLPIHLTQTLKPEQKSNYLLRDNVSFLPPHYYWSKD